MTKQKTQSDGFTLIEAIMMIVVLGIAIPPLVYLFQQVSVRSVDHNLQQMGLAYAQGMMEETVSRAFEDPDLAAGSFGTEEGARSGYDDIDDYDGWTASPPQQINGTLLDDYVGFTRSVVVENVTALSPDPTVSETDGSTQLKRIKVTVAWSGGQGGKLTLTTLRTNLGSTVVGNSPLDEAATEATAARSNSKDFTIDLISAVTDDREVASFSLSADRAMPDLKEFKMLVAHIWKEPQGVAMPTGTVSLNLGSASDRTVPAGATVASKFEFRSAPSAGAATYTLVLNFTDGSSSTLTFTITW